jgi:hypothetical protein
MYPRSYSCGSTRNPRAAGLGLWLGAGRVIPRMDKEPFGVESPDMLVPGTPNPSLDLCVFSTGSLFQWLAARPTGGARVRGSPQLIADVVPVVVEGSTDFKLPKPFHLNRDQRS